MPVSFRRKRPQPVETPPEASPTQKSLARPSAEEIFKQVAINARQELKRSTLALGISGFGGGAFMGLSALGVSMVTSLLGNAPAARIFASMFYPLGFIVVILGRSQLFTENTLYPVALVLSEKKELRNTLRLWSVVFPANVAGALAFAMIAARTPAIDPSIVRAMVQLGLNATAHSGLQIFWSGIIAGWVIALAAWMVSGSHSITGSVMVIWMLTFVIGLGNFAHCVASSCEVLVAVLAHRAPWSAYPVWLFPAVTGNICGGVGLVTILEYGQVLHVSEDAFEEHERLD